MKRLMPILFALALLAFASSVLAEEKCLAPTKLVLTEQVALVPTDLPLTLSKAAVGFGATEGDTGKLAFSIITSTGSKPISGMASYKVVETKNGELSGHIDLLYISTEDSLALGLSGRVKKLEALPLIKGGGACVYWSFRHECVKGRVYIINVTF